LISQKNYIISKINLKNKGNTTVNFTEIYYSINYDMNNITENFVQLPLKSENKIIYNESEFLGIEYNKSYILCGSNISNLLNSKLYSSIFLWDMNNIKETRICYPEVFPNRVNCEIRPIIINENETKDFEISISWYKENFYPENKITITKAIGITNSLEIMSNNYEDYIKTIVVSDSSKFQINNVYNEQNLFNFNIYTSVPTLNSNISLNITTPIGYIHNIGLNCIDNKNWNGSILITRDGSYVFRINAINLGGYRSEYNTIIYLSLFNLNYKIGFIIIILTVSILICLFLVFNFTEFKKQIK
jgi:hypothetical protein